MRSHGGVQHGCGPPHAGTVASPGRGRVLVLPCQTHTHLGCQNLNLNYFLTSIIHAELRTTTRFRPSLFSGTFTRQCPHIRTGKEPVRIRMLFESKTIRIFWHCLVNSQRMSWPKTCCGSCNTVDIYTSIYHIHTTKTRSVQKLARVFPAQGAHVGALAVGVHAQRLELVLPRAHARGRVYATPLLD